MSLDIGLLWNEVVEWMANGLWDLSWWQLLLYTLITTHFTIAGVTIFLHRSQAHRALDLGPVPSHFFRFWLWLGTGMVTKEWVAIHRKHHAKCETVDDPHSPQTRGLSKVMREGAELYRSEAKNTETIKKFGHGTPDDWLERNLYSKHSVWGPTLMLILNLALFGVIGMSIWAVQMVWIPFWAAGVVNGLGHFWAIAITRQRTPPPTCRPGESSLVVKSFTTTTIRIQRRPSSRSSPMSLILAGSISASCRSWAGPRSRRRRRACAWARSSRWLMS